ncbi:hypothetical protein [Paraburkholderia kirstenboschensis]|jgi:hypothetical protein|uniref:Uncharacterized protein n=1 Tax=Paraburkholderia kirstenboschensis TaxID=1245436 RepID=A0ABZ0EGC9_9BURK|nr:hypothetical protein [Paraburkholderia kirstenboschensis]WOD15614.1 hypothetical protein RW095_20340 [Paraburkholderia kirstenboschensis]
MSTRLVAIAALALAFAGTGHAQGGTAGSGTSRPRADTSSAGAAKPQAPASAPATGSTSLPVGSGIIVAPDEGARPPRPEASPGTPANPSGLKKPD